MILPYFSTHIIQKLLGNALNEAVGTTSVIANLYKEQNDLRERTKSPYTYHLHIIYYQTTSSTEENEYRGDL